MTQSPQERSSAPCHRLGGVQTPLPQPGRGQKESPHTLHLDHVSSAWLEPMISEAQGFPHLLPAPRLTASLTESPAFLMAQGEASRTL